MPYDVVWYSPDRMQDAERVLKRLELAEAVERDCPDLCLSQPGIRIPGQKILGRCAVRNFLGASDCLSLGCTDGIAALCDITEHGEGLVGGTLKDEFWLSSGLAAAEQIAAEREALLRAMKPPTARQLFRCARVALGTAVLSFIASIVAIPRSMKRVPPKTIRPLGILDAESLALMGAITRGVQ